MNTTSVSLRRLIAVVAFCYRSDTENKKEVILDINYHAELALLNVEYAVADCDLMAELAVDNQSLARIANVSLQLVSAKSSLEYLLKELEPSFSPWPNGTPPLKSTT